MKMTTLLAAVVTLSVGAGGYAVVRASVESPDRAFHPIVRTDLDRTPTANVYEAVNELRSGWLPRDSTDHVGITPTVFIELRCKEVACLRWIEANQVERIEYLAHDSAPQRLHQGAAIVVTTRTRAVGLNADTTGAG